MKKWTPTHCLRGESPLPVMRVEEIDGVTFYHDGFAPRVKMVSAIFNRLYIPIEEYAARKQKNRGSKGVARKGNVLPLPTAADLAKRRAKKPAKPTRASKMRGTDFFA